MLLSTGWPVTLGVPRQPLFTSLAYCLTWYTLSGMVLWPYAPVSHSTDTALESNDTVVAAAPW